MKMQTIACIRPIGSDIDLKKYIKWKNIKSILYRVQIKNLFVDFVYRIIDFVFQKYFQLNLFSLFLLLFLRCIFIIV